MHPTLSESAKRVMAVASEEAKAFNHCYVGTEHILLALLLDGSPDAGGTLQRLGLSAAAVRKEIEMLVSRGPQTTGPDKLPLTPRAQRAIQFASEEAARVNVWRIEPAHLLIGLVREPDGVAGQVMRKLGMQPDVIRAEALKMRMLQLRAVERCVRPVRAGIKHKRKMREELLAHLTAIYQDELAGTNDPMSALDIAVTRLGDPSQLSRELQSAVPASGRREHFAEYWIGWRAPESALRMIARTSILSFLIVVVFLGVPVLAKLLFDGGVQNQSAALRLLGAFLVLVPTAQFAVGLCYYKTRDALWGLFGSRRSGVNAVLWSGLAGLMAIAVSAGFVAATEGTGARAAGSLPVLALIAALTTLTLLLQARTRGQTEICDTIWATLDLDAAS